LYLGYVVFVNIEATPVNLGIQSIKQVFLIFGYLQCI